MGRETFGGPGGNRSGRWEKPGRQEKPSPEWEAKAWGRRRSLGGKTGKDSLGGRDPEPGGGLAAGRWARADTGVAVGPPLGGRSGAPCGRSPLRRPGLQPSLAGAQPVPGACLYC